MGRRERKPHRPLIHAARQLRAGMTPAETVLWEELRGQRRGYKVRRQEPIGPYVVDFYVPQAKLAIEVDGPVHEERHDQDTNRDANLKAEGIRVLRFSNAAVEGTLEVVLASIDEAVADPHPAP